MIDIKKFTIVPEDFRNKDPRQFGYHQRNEIPNSERAFITYNKYVSQFLFYYSLQAAEEVAKCFDRILVPTDCLNWRRAQQLAQRRIYVGRKSFYTMSPEELRQIERKKLLKYLELEGVI